MIRFIYGYYNVGDIHRYEEVYELDWIIVGRAESIRTDFDGEALTIAVL